jgi:hypothetical protein
MQSLIICYNATGFKELEYKTKENCKSEKKIAQSSKHHGDGW